MGLHNEGRGHQTKKNDFYRDRAAHEIPRIFKDLQTYGKDCRFSRVHSTQRDCSVLIRRQLRCCSQGRKTPGGTLAPSQARHAARGARASAHSIRDHGGHTSNCFTPTSPALSPSQVPRNTRSGHQPSQIQAWVFHGPGFAVQEGRTPT